MKRVNFLCLVLLGLFFTACHSNDDTWGDWSRSFSFGGFPRTGAVTFTIDDVVYVGLGYNIQLDQQDKTLTDFWMYKDRIWTQIADFPGEGRYGAVAFVVDGKAYVGTGYRPDQNTTTEQYFNDFIAMIQVRIHGVMYQSLICLMVQLPVVMLWPLV